MTNYLEELNESQRNAVLYNEGPSLVIAGAGSGKTRVLTYKIAYLLERGYTPWSILALTFTNKAAREMKERIARQVGDQARYLWMGTFHSIFSRILRCEAQAVGFTSNFTIYDSSDSKSLIKSIVKEMQLDDKTYKPGVIQARISNAKNHLVFPDAYVSNAELYQYDLNAKVPAVIFTDDIGNVVAKAMRWILMICWFILICYSAIIPKSAVSMRSSSVMCWWMSIRILILRNTALCFSLPKNISVYA